MPLMGFIVAERREVAVDDDGDGQDAGRRTASSTATTRRRRPTVCPGSEGTFSLCTFLYVDALARSGRLDEARLTFAKMLTYANHLGLYSEEIDPTGEQLGNFPQAFTHLALIDAAVNLDYQLDDADGRVGPRHASDQSADRSGQPARPSAGLRRVLVPLALAQFICSFAGSNMNVMITDISTDLDTTVQGVQIAITIFLLVMAALDDPRRQADRPLGSQAVLHARPASSTASAR